MHIVPPVAFVLKQVIEEGMTDVLLAVQYKKISYPGLCPKGPFNANDGMSALWCLAFQLVYVPLLSFLHIRIL